MIRCGFRDIVDLDVLESCGNGRRSGNSASETRSKLAVEVESKECEGGREAEEERSGIEVGAGVIFTDRQSRQSEEKGEEGCEPSHIKGLD